MDDIWDGDSEFLATTGPLTQGQLWTAIVSSIGGYMLPLLLLGLPLAAFLRSGRRRKDGGENGENGAADIDPEQASAYATALGIPIEDAERMLREACSDVPCEVLPRLFLGNAAASANALALQRAGVTHVLNATGNLPNHFEGILKYMRVPLEDSLDADLTPHLDGACDFISSVLAEPSIRGGVLVHCRQGVSRSASIVIAFCMRERGLRLDEALAIVSEARWVHPNEAFLKQLAAYEQTTTQAARTTVN